MTMQALNRKLWRDLWRLRGQILATAIVMASGLAVLINSLSTITSLQESSQAYYERYRFADVFAQVTRAPLYVLQRVAELPGVQSVSDRIAKVALLDVPDFPEPVMARLVSVPEHGQPVLNRLALLSGRWISSGHDSEVIVSQAFAKAHGLVPGDHFSAIINGTRKQLDIVGLALSPEFVYVLGPGALVPDDQRFGIIWMGRSALSAAYDQQGAFNDLSLSLMRNASADNVITALDSILAPYGAIGAVARKDQLSNWFLMNEIEQLESMSTILPAIFLLVAAFLIQMVMRRMIATERSEIGLLKAFGYSDWQVAWHYLKLVLLISLAGIVLGSLTGIWLGRFSTQMYSEFFRFPVLLYRPNTAAFAIGAGISVSAALGGAWGAVRQAALLPPAEAMRPPSPPVYRRGRLADSRMGQWLDQPSRLIIRHLMRWPARTGLTTLGIALSVALAVMSLQWNDALMHLAEVSFYQAQRQHAVLGLNEPRSTRVLAEVSRLPGVLASEPMRIVSADLSAGNRRHRGGIQALPSDASLQPVYDINLGPLRVPADGLVLGSLLAEKLGVRIGGTVHVEILSGRRPVFDIPVVAVVDTYVGMPAYMNLTAFNRRMQQRPVTEYINILLDPAATEPLLGKLKAVPTLASVTLKQAAVDSFHATINESMLIYMFIFSMFAGALAFGVIYTSMRITLMERGRELSTLRVMGFRRAEIAYVLLGEAGLLLLAALPLGLVLGYALVVLIAAAFETELFRVPVFIENSSYAYAGLIALAAGVCSAMIIRWRLNRLDLIKVLKTRA